MIIKEHQKSEMIVYLEALEQRFQLTEDEHLKLKLYRWGNEGEVKFKHMIEHIDAPVIWDLLLDDNGYVQYDFIVVGAGAVYHFDVKNNAGAYQYDRGNIKSAKSVIKDYRPQLMRADSMLKALLEGTGCHYEVHSRIVFVNETFSLTGFDGDQRVIFPGQLERIVNHLESLKVTERDQEVAKLLVRLHQEKNPFDVVRHHPFEHMKPGLRCCGGCQKLLEIDKDNWQEFECVCGVTMKRHELMLGTLRELEILKREAYGIREVMEWTGFSKSTCNRLLNRYALKIGDGKSAKYILKDGLLAGK